MRALKKIARRESGIALLTTILLMLLMSSLLVGFIILINSGQKLSGMSNEYSRSFYAAEAGMEKMTADLGSLFDSTYSPSYAQLSAITTGPTPGGPPVLSGINYIKSDGTSGYELNYPSTCSTCAPTASVTQIQSGPYQGMTALATPYTLTVTAKTSSGAEVKLRRTTQTVGIPMFQFGVFSDSDLSFFPGPPFNFGGRTHTNGNLFLATGGSLTMSDRVTAVKDVIRSVLSNGWDANTNYAGTVSITTGSSYRTLKIGEDSLSGVNTWPLSSPSPNSKWPNISLGASNYAGNLRNGATGATKLDLGIVTLGSGTTQAIDIIRRPGATESTAITTERYFAQASLKILLSDDPSDITSLPCTTTSAPFNLASIAAPVADWSTNTSSGAYKLKALMTANNAAGYNTPPVPLAASGAVQGQTSYTINDHNGYWLPNPSSTQNPYLDAGKNFRTYSGYPTIKGYIKIEVQTNYNDPCNNWKDVTLEVLGYGYAGRNINPYGGLSGSVNDSYPASTTAKSQVNPGYSSTGVNPPLLLLPTSTISPSTCQDVHPNAIIRLERVRDNPSTWSSTLACGVKNNITPASQIYPTFPTDYWPNALFDTREGTLRDNSPGGSLGSGTSGTYNYNSIAYNKMVTFGGVMNYVEIDVKNLTKYLKGTLPGSGNSSYDSAVAPNDFTVYISDRRGNYTATPLTTSWPAKSPTKTETGEYGFEDFVNAADSSGCPNTSVDKGEDLDALGSGTLFTYGQDPTHAMAAGTAAASLTAGQYGTYATTSLTATNVTGALAKNVDCTGVSSPSSTWPMTEIIHANEARQNPNPFFRRAVKLTDGSDLSGLGSCPGGIACGLTIAVENPVYIEGDYNCPSGCSGGTYNDPHVASSVLGDAVTLLSNNWNDVNSFIGPYSTGTRPAVTTYFRTAIVAGKGISFPRPSYGAQDFGTDGGVHNFLRFVENWGGQTLNYKGSIISMYYNRQATGLYKCCNTVYSAPSRGYNFDVEFLQPQLLPPRTPLFRDTNTTGFTQLMLPNQ